MDDSKIMNMNIDLTLDIGYPMAIEEKEYLKEVLKRQVPTKVAAIQMSAPGCPNCGIKVKGNFCSNCGQKLIY